MARKINFKVVVVIMNNDVVLANFMFLISTSRVVEEKGRVFFSLNLNQNQKYLHEEARTIGTKEIFSMSISICTVDKIEKVKKKPHELLYFK
jgi:hypothetical protein